MELTVTYTAAGTANFLSWQHAKFTADELADSSRSGPNAIYGTDGLTNLVKYALGLDPKVNNNTGVPVATTTADDWVYIYTRPSATTDLTYDVEISTDLVNWTTNGITLDPVSTSGGIDTWNARYPRTAVAKIFFRLKVTR